MILNYKIDRNNRKVDFAPGTTINEAAEKVKLIVELENQPYSFLFSGVTICVYPEDDLDTIIGKYFSVVN